MDFCVLLAFAVYAGAVNGQLYVLVEFLILVFKAPTFPFRSFFI